MNDVVPGYVGTLSPQDRARQEQEREEVLRERRRRQERQQIVLDDTNSRITILVHVEGSATKHFEMAALQQAPITLQLGRIFDSHVDAGRGSGDFAVSFERLEIPTMVIDAVHVDPAAIVSKDPDEPRKSRYDLIKENR